ATTLSGVVPFMSVLADFTDGDGSFFNLNFGTIGDGASNGFWFRQGTSVQDLDLTEEEEAVLDAWIDQQFLPAFKLQLKPFKSFMLTPPTTAQFEAAYNKAQEFIGVLRYHQTYVFTAGESGYSSNMI